jgi:HAD superfamily hydrolase (TIGR01458 family)
MFDSLKAVFLDISGVLYEGSKAIAGAAEAVTALREKQLLLRFVTNTATCDSQVIIGKLAAMGIVIVESELFTAPLAARHYVLQEQLRPYCLVHKAIVDMFADLDQHNPNCVIVGDAREDLCYHTLNQAFRLCQQGAVLIGIGMNKYFMEEDGLSLDAGPFIRALEWAASTEAIIMGKPSQAFYQQVVASTPFAASQCLMVGDDVSADVEGAIHAGMAAVLVATGKFQPEDKNRMPAKARLIDSIADLPALLG